MVKTLNRVLSIALILAVVGIGVFWMLQRGKPGNNPHVLVEQASSELQAGRGSREWVQNYLEKWELTEAENRKMERVLESQVYQDFLATHPDSMGEILDFFATQGVELPYAEFLAELQPMFRKHFPEVSAAELEPVMRGKLSALVAANDVRLGTDTEEEALENMIVGFLAADENLVWIMAHFEGDYFAFGRWAVEVLQNPSLPDAAAPAFSDTNNPPTSAEGERLKLAPAEQATTPQDDREPAQSVMSPSFEDVDGSIEHKDTLFTESEDDIADRLTLEAAKSTDESLETSLRESFSSARFSSALETLNRYGPEEGLRRLKAADPVVAAHVSRFLHKQQEEK